MMSQINQYIFKQTLWATLMVALVLCVTVALVQSVRLVDLIVNHGLSLANFGWLLLLMMPRLLSYCLPITIFVGIYSCYRRLTAESELTVMRAIGFSDGKLQMAGYLTAIVIMIFCFGLNLFLTPISYSTMRDEVFKHKSQWSLALVKEGKFTNLGDDITLYVRERDGDNLIDLMYDNRSDPNAPFSIFAKFGQLVDDGNNPSIVIQSGVRQSVENGIMRFISFDRTILEIAGDTPLSRSNIKSTEELFIDELLFPDEESLSHPDHAREYKAQAHKLLSQPLLILALTATAFALLFNIPFSRRTTIKPTLIASLIAAGLIIAHILAGIIAAKNAAFNPLQYMLPLSSFAIASYFALRPKYWANAKKDRPAPQNQQAYP